MTDPTAEYFSIALQPYEDESISHYLGRWKRQEVVSLSSIGSLSRQLRLGTAMSRWEKFYLNPFPTLKQLEQLGKVMGIEGERLLLMFPPKGEPINVRIVRLCCACYDEAPYHRMKWQFQSTAAFEKHQLRLLYKCPNCEQHLPIPAEWESGRCRKCQMLFRSMIKHQKPARTPELMDISVST